MSGVFQRRLGMFELGENVPHVRENLLVLLDRRFELLDLLLHDREVFGKSALIRGSRI
jgi:hypothetical protein